MRPAWGGNRPAAEPEYEEEEEEEEEDEEQYRIAREYKVSLHEAAAAGWSVADHLGPGWCWLQDELAAYVKTALDPAWSFSRKRVYTYVAALGPLSRHKFSY